MTGSADYATRVFVTDRLRAARDENSGRLPHRWLAEMSQATGIATSTLRRYIADGVPEPRHRQRWEFDRDARVTFYRAAGDVVLTRKLLIDDRGPGAVPSLKTMYRARDRDLSPDEQMLATRGHAAARGRRLVVALEDEHRNETWFSDHSQLDFDVLELRGTHPVRPWMTIVLDGYSRRVVGASLSIAPNQGHVLAALGMAIRQCGRPRVLIYDRGREFLASSVQQHAASLDYVHMPTIAYHPHHKGKVERFNATFNRMMLHAVGTTPRPATDVRGRPLLGERLPVPIRIAERLFYETIDAYNQRHEHRSLGGMTPQAFYDSDPTPERTVHDAVLRRFVLSEEHRKIGEYGIRFRGRDYWAPELEGHLGVRVEVRFAQDDQRQLEIYRDGRYWCTVELVDPASAEQASRVLAGRAAHVERQRQELSQAKRLNKRQMKATTDRQNAQDTTLITRGDVQRETAGVPPRVLEALRSLNLGTDLDPIPASAAVSDVVEPGPVAGAGGSR
jgi:putative transposase